MIDRTIFTKLDQKLDEFQTKQRTLKFETLSPELVSTMMWFAGCQNYSALVSTFPPWIKTKNLNLYYYRRMLEVEPNLTFRLEFPYIKHLELPHDADLPDLSPLDIPFLLIAAGDHGGHEELRTKLLTDLPERIATLSLLKKASQVLDQLRSRCSEAELLLMFPVTQGILGKRTIERKRNVSEKRRQEICFDLDITSLMHILAMMSFNGHENS
jgi:hypothetical protein